MKARGNFNSNVVLAFPAAVLLLAAYTLCPPAVHAQSVPGGEPVYFDHLLSDGSLAGGLSTVGPEETADALDAVRTLSLPAAVTIVDNGSSDNRVDLVVMGDGYQETELLRFADASFNLVQKLFLENPLRQYQQYFNVHRIDLASIDSGVDNDPINGVDRSTVLGMKFWCQGVQGNLCINLQAAWDAAEAAPQADQLVVLANSMSSGGSAYPWSDLALISGGDVLAAENLLHQFGHSFGNLVDEYDSGSWPEFTGAEPAEPNVSALGAEQMTAQRIKWYRWLGANIGSTGLIAAYEGAMQHRYRIYRPTFNSKMRSLGAPFNPPSIESLILQIYRNVRPIDGATPPDAVLRGNDTISVTPMRPSDHELSVQWSVDGQPVQGAVGTAFRPDDYPLRDGQHEVTVTVVDNTPLVRNEEERAQWMTDGRIWTVTTDQSAPVILVQPADQTVDAGQTATFSVGAAGGGLSYQWYRNDAPISGANRSSYSTPAAVKADHGSLFWVKVWNLEGTVESSRAKLLLNNHAPVLSPIPNQSMGALDKRSVTLYATDPDGDALTFSAALYQSAGVPAVLRVAGNVLEFELTSNYIGRFQIAVTVSDGMAEAVKVFEVTAANNLPVLEPIAKQRMHWRQDKLNLTLSASDPDGNMLVYSAVIVGTAPVSLNVLNNVLTIDPAADYLGTFTVRASASDGYAASYRDFQVEVWNDPPVFGMIAGSVYLFGIGGSIHGVDLKAVNSDGDPLSYSFGFQNGQVVPPIPITMVGSVVTIDDTSRWQGTILMTGAVTDGIATVRTHFKVVFANSPPTVYPIPDQRMHWRQDKLTVKVNAVDSATPDTVKIGAGFVDSAGNAPPVALSVAGDVLTIDPAEGYTGTFGVRVWASDGELVSNTVDFRVTVYNVPPTLTDIPDQRIQERQDFLNVPLIADSPDGDPLTFSAYLAANQDLPISLRVEGRTLTVDPQEGWRGTAQVSVKACDGICSDAKTFLVTTYNEPPFIDVIPNQEIHWNEQVRRVPFHAWDPDGDKLSLEVYTGRLYEPDTLFANFRFTKVAEGFYYNLLGHQEKYIQGHPVGEERDHWYAIFPDGNVYQQDGARFSIITWHPLPLAFYKDPSLLLQAQPAIGASVAIEGSEIVITKNPGYHGTFQVVLKASDGGDRPLGMVFNVTALDVEPVLQPIRAHRMHWRQESLEIPLSAEDADENAAGDELTFTADPFWDQAAYNLDQVYNFAPRGEEDTDYADNHEGFGEKYFRGTKDGVKFWYAVLPGGELYQYSGRLSASLLLARLLPVYHEDPRLLFDVPPEPEQYPFTLTVQGGSLRIASEPRYSGRYLIKAKVSAGGKSDAETFVLEVFDNQPAFVKESLPTNFSLSYKTLRHSIPIEATDPDNEQITYTAGIMTNPSGLTELADAYQWRAANDDFDYNRYGRREKWLLGAKDGAPVRLFILPSGQLFEFTGSFRSSTLLAEAHFSYWARAEALLEVAGQPVYPRPVDVHMEGNRLIIDPPDNSQVGWMPIRIVASDGYKHDQIEFYFEIVNHAPVFDNIKNAYSLHYGTGPLSVPFTVGEPDGEPITLSVEHDPSFRSGFPAGEAPAALQVRNGLVEIDPRPGYVGYFLVRVRASDGVMSSTWSFVVDVTNVAPEIADIPEQTLKRNEVRTLTIPASDRESDPLTYAIETSCSTGGGVAFALSGASITMTPQAGWTGYCSVKATVRDQIAETSRNFIVRVANSAPVLSAIENVTLKRNESRQIRLAASDADGDSLTYSAAMNCSAAGGAAMNLSGDLLTITPKIGWVGSCSVRAAVTDGLSEDAKTFTAQIGNTPPVLNLIVNQTLSRNETARVIELAGSDADGDLLTFSASLPAGSTVPAALSVSGSTLTITMTKAWLGTFQVTAAATDGLAQASRVFAVTVKNSAPEIANIAAKKISHRQSSFDVSLSASDADNDPITFSATVSGGHTAAVSGSTLAVTPKSGFSGSFTVVVQASDGLLADSTSFIVTVTNAPPVFSAVANQTMHWRNWTMLIPFTVSDADGDSVTVSAALGSGPADKAQVSVEGSAVRFRLLEANPGPFTVQLTAGDGLVTVTTMFQISITNSKPVMQPLPDVQVGVRNNSFSVTLGASDADNDPLTYTVEAKSGQTLAYELDQVHNFELRYGDYYYNRTGNYEKYVQGTKNTSGIFWYAIFPDGRLYDWRGRLSLSVVLARLPRGYYDDPSKLFDVAGPLPAPAEVSMSGSTVAVSPQRDFIGDFIVGARVSDGYDSDSKSFIVSVVDDREDERCVDHRITICHHTSSPTHAWQTITIACPALPAHLAHGDTVGPCPGDEPEVCGRPAVNSPTYTLWNSFLSMVNILELSNPGAAEISVKATLYSIRGEVADEKVIPIPARGQRDLILNELPGFVVDSYGIVKLEFNGTLEGRMMYYRQAAEWGNYDFVFGFPLGDPNQGTTAVSFNTFQPSFKAEERSNLVANWLTIVNLESYPETFVVMTYDQNGTLVMRRSVEVPAFGRADIDGGHDLAGPSVVGAHIITPSRGVSRYLGQITRYGGDVPAGFAPSRYRFAFALTAKPGNSGTINAPISHKYGEDNWLEVVNILGEEVPLELNFFDSAGTQLDAVYTVLPPHAQQHFDAAALLGAREHGFVTMRPAVPASIIAQSMVYYKEPQGSVTAIYGSQAARSTVCEQNGSYNLFLGMENWLTLVNTDEQSAQVRIRVDTGEMSREQTYDLGAKTSLRLPLHDNPAFGVPANSYGSINLSLTGARGRLYAEMLRLRFTDGMADVAVPTAVR